MSTNKHTFIPAAAPLFAALFAVPLLLSSAPAMAQGTAAHQPKVAATTLPGPSDELLTKLERIYKDIHANPELSMEEQRTAGIAAEWLRQHGYEVTEGVGKTGVVGLLRNG